MSSDSIEAEGHPAARIVASADIRAAHARIAAAYSPHPGHRDRLAGRRRAERIAEARMPSGERLVQGARRVPQPSDPPCPGCGLRHRLGRQSRRGGRLRGGKARRSGAGVRAGNFDPGEDRPDPVLRRRDGRCRRILRRGAGALRRLCRRKRRPQNPPLRRARDDRRRRHGRPRMGGGSSAPRPAGARHGARRGRRRRSDRRRRGLVCRTRQGGRRRAGRFARAARGASKPAGRSTSRSSRSPPIRSAQGGSANGTSPSPAGVSPRSSLVPDAAIVEAQRRLWRDVSIVAEPGGAAAFAALISGAWRPGKGRARRHPRLRRERRSRGARETGVTLAECPFYQLPTQAGPGGTQTIADGSATASSTAATKSRATIAAEGSPNYCPPAFRRARIGPAVPWGVAKR